MERMGVNNQSQGFPIKRLSEFCEQPSRWLVIAVAVSFAFFLLGPVLISGLFALDVSYETTMLPLMAFGGAFLIKLKVSHNRALSEYVSYLEKNDKKTLLLVRDSVEISDEERAAIRKTLDSKFPGWSLT